APEEGYVLDAQFVRDVVEALDHGADEEVKELVADLHAADFADLLGLMGAADRRALVETMGRALDPEVLTELDEDVRDDVLDYVSPELLARAVRELDSDDAVYLLEDLKEERQQEILGRVPNRERAAVEFALQYPENSAGRIMQRQFVGVPPDWTVGRVIDYMRESDGLPEDFFEIYVLDPGQHVMGAVPVSRLLRTKRPTGVEQIMNAGVTCIPADMEQEEAAYLFQQYHLASAPVVDGDRRVVGMLTVDDIVDVIQEEHEEDVLALAGVAPDEGLSDNVLTTARGRMPWLVVNLMTAIFASVVIGLFEGALDKLVPLAILMPIVASMGGNAGTQTLTIAVRALATKDLTAANAARIVLREALVGGLNGVLFAVVMGIVAAFWFSAYPQLAVVVGVAMIVNLLCAGLAGILVPLWLQRAGADPAVASTVFVTTVTDVVGFFTFLGLASWVLLG
ncbi:MAG: magnesium transporter, partial [Alphaproteobacteria bacterium]